MTLPTSYLPADYPDTLLKPYDPGAQPRGKEIATLIEHATTEGRAAILSSSRGPQVPSSTVYNYDLASAAMHHQYMRDDFSCGIMRGHEMTVAAIRNMRDGRPHVKGE